MGPLAALVAAVAIFPNGTPQWLQDAALRAAHGNGEPNPTVVQVLLGRYPIVVLGGTFVCDACSRPSGTAAPHGHFIAIRYDARTRRDHDFAMCDALAGCLSNLCGRGGPCTPGDDRLDSAFEALRADQPPGAELPFDNRAGTSRCHIRLPTRAYRWILGVCSVRISGRVLRFDESWRAGRHTWVVFENAAGWVTRVVSTGKQPPQDP